MTPINSLVLSVWFGWDRSFGLPRIPHLGWTNIVHIYPGKATKQKVWGGEDGKGRKRGHEPEITKQSRGLRDISVDKYEPMACPLNSAMWCHNCLGMGTPRWSHRESHSSPNSQYCPKNEQINQREHLDVWGNRPEHLKLTTHTGMISTANPKDLGLLSRRATRHICGGLSWSGQEKQKIHPLVSGAIPWARVPGWVRRTRPVEDQHPSPSTIWLQLQYDQLPSAPAPWRTVPTKWESKGTLSPFSCFCVLFFASYHNVQSNKYPLAIYSSPWIYNSSPWIS